jgi:hypothetical protein
MLDWPHVGASRWPRWEPVRPYGSPWLSSRPLHVKVARTYVVTSGPQLLRVAYAPHRGTIPASAGRGPVADRRSR